jgi:hypothetical protein
MLLLMKDSDDSGENELFALAARENYTKVLAAY